MPDFGTYGIRPFLGNLAGAKFLAGFPDLGDFSTSASAVYLPY